MNSPSLSAANSNNTQASKAVAALPPVNKNLPEFQGISQWLNSAQRVGGVMILATAIAIILGWDVQVQLWLAPLFPISL